ncbi:uncharacterized protein GGS22DRAFT_186645 [Annulohypoxylon maeteangense]|uniref:uncharacterized protein n=1 Tax=Annulohypoxylon maeteangense TaxID=1927788 RepID=UPI00200870D4|nr:uncharacterized protein GGS22DRAFT_186645 [Annulohypoxylon maeteangense]KAI0886576.1 hypothetical protein GGS22DRAFT_186645 [Annulohypoxylon maeteangense]
MDSSNPDDQSEPRLKGKHNKTRPLRTYSKRALPTDTSEPVSKKRRIEETSIGPERTDEATEPPHQSEIACPSPTLPPSKPKKGSIMSYFKVMQPMPSSSAISSEPTSGPTEPASTPPSSPPMFDLNRKKRRRLTTRIISRATSNDPNQEDIVEGEDQRSDDIGDGSVASASPADALSDASSNTLDRPTAKRKKQFGVRKHRRNKEDQKPSAVQTTLSLSLSEKGFTECKECNMLYNPLHKQDAKCHASRHAAMLKAKSSTPDNQISD